ncbi:hypothetical protein BvRS1_26180 [Burkholderia vietnamiensis]|nr:hypothetical protein BvRS1_26180 [Burkholderia vietnamiensis]
MPETDTQPRGHHASRSPRRYGLANALPPCCPPSAPQLNRQLQVAAATTYSLFGCREPDYPLPEPSDPDPGAAPMTHSVIPAGLADEMIDIRHRIHAHPERGFEEFATSVPVAEQLQG